MRDKSNFPIFLAVALVLGLTSTVRAQTSALEVVSRQQALARLYSHWEELRLILAADKFDPAGAKEAFRSLMESQWDAGMREDLIHSASLLEWADHWRQRGDSDAAEWLVESALRLSPGSARVRAAAGRHYLAGGNFNPAKSITNYLEAVALSGSDFAAAARAAGFATLLPIFFLLVFGGVLAVLTAIRSLPLLFHDLTDLFPPIAASRWIVRGLIAVMLLLPLGAGLPVWWIISLWLVVFSIYMENTGRALVFVWFVALAAFPFIIELNGVVFGSRADETFQAALRVRAGNPEPGDLDRLDRAAEKDDSDLLVRLSLADLLLREGNAESATRALGIYDDLASRPETAKAALNNRVSILYAMGDLKGVGDSLAAAAEKDPANPDIVFNQGQYNQAIGQVTRHEELLASARDLDPSRAAELSEIGAMSRLGRLFVLIPADSSLVWKRALKRSPEESAVIQGLWTGLIGAFPRPGVTHWAACLIGLAGAGIILLSARNWKLSSRCTSCGRPICRVCHPASKAPGVCLACYNVFRGHGGIDLKEKMSHSVRVRKYHDRWRLSGWLLTLLLPGTGHFLLGATGTGAVMFFICSAEIASILSVRELWPASGPLYQGGNPGSLIALAAVHAVLVIVAVFSYRGKAEDWR